MTHKRTGTVYRIVVRSELSDRHAGAFEGMEMETKDGETILTGKIIDQPHLFGILDRLNSLGLELLTRIIHERSIGLPLAYRKSAEYTGKVAYSQYFQLDTLKTEFPLFIN